MRCDASYGEVRREGYSFAILVPFSGIASAIATTYMSTCGIFYDNERTWHL